MEYRPTSTININMVGLAPVRQIWQTVANIPTLPLSLSARQRVASFLVQFTNDSATNALHLFLLFLFHAFPVAFNALGPPAPPSSMTFHEFVLHMQPTRSIPPSLPVECHLTLSFHRLLPHPPSVRSGPFPFGLDARRLDSLRRSTDV